MSRKSLHLYCIITLLYSFGLTPTPISLSLQLILSLFIEYINPFLSGFPFQFGDRYVIDFLSSTTSLIFQKPLLDFLIGFYSTIITFTYQIIPENRLLNCSFWDIKYIDTPLSNKYHLKQSTIAQFRDSHLHYFVLFPHCGPLKLKILEFNGGPDGKAKSIL